MMLVVFEVEYECKNCGNEFVERYGEGFRVHSETYTEGPYVEDTEKFGVARGKWVECPTCKMSRDVYVTKRVPISEIIKENEAVKE